MAYHPAGSGINTSSSHTKNHRPRYISSEAAEAHAVGSWDHVDEDQQLVHARRALSRCPINHPKRAQKCMDLARLLWERSRDTGDETFLEDAIVLGREALSLTSVGPSRARACADLADSLIVRFDRRGNESLLDEAIRLQQEALRHRPNDHPGRARLCLDLANSLQRRFSRTNDTVLLDEIITLKREALLLRPDGHPARARFCTNLADSLTKRFAHTGDETSLNEAILYAREALSLRPEGHPDRFRSCGNLAGPLVRRFDRTGDETLLDEAITLQEEAVCIIPNGVTGRGLACLNLAVSLEKRFERTGDVKLLDRAITLEHESLSLRPEAHPGRARSCTSLAVSLEKRFEHTGNISELEEAVALKREALALRPENHPDHARSCAHLAKSLYSLFAHTSNESLVRESEELYIESLCSYSEEHPGRWQPLIGLARLLLDRQHSGYDVARALNYLSQAISPGADNLPQLLSEVAALFWLIPHTSLPVPQQRALLQLHSAAIDLSSLVAGFVLDQASQLKYLTACQHLGPDAYMLARLLGELDYGLKLLERARGIMWTQMLHMRDPQVQDLPPRLASELESLLRSMAHVQHPDIQQLSSIEDDDDDNSPPLLQDEDIRHQRHTRIQQLIEQARALPGHADFMRGPSLDVLEGAAAQHAIVVLIAARQDCQALIIQSGTLTSLLLEDIKPGELQSIGLDACSSRDRRGGATENPKVEHRGMKVSSGSPPQHALGHLWTTVVKPVITSLGIMKANGSSRPRIHWCPTGAFTFAPIHAAGIYEGPDQECCSDYVVSSYTPSLTALSRAQTHVPTIRRPDLKLALLAAEHAQDATLPPLSNVKSEIQDIAGVAEHAHVSLDERLPSNDATTARVSKSLEAANIVHIACHGVQNMTDALASGFYLSDGRLTISKLMELDLKHAFLAFLSACETAKGDQEQPDQTIHLAAAMLFAGFRSVFATMWAMDDADGPYVAKLFYEKLFAEEVITVDAIPYALDHAVTELRKNGAPPERWATFIHMGA